MKEKGRKNVTVSDNVGRDKTKQLNELEIANLTVVSNTWEWGGLCVVLLCNRSHETKSILTLST